MGRKQLKSGVLRVNAMRFNFFIYICLFISLLFSSYLMKQQGNESVRFDSE